MVEEFAKARDSKKKVFHSFTHSAYFQSLLPPLSILLYVLCSIYTVYSMCCCSEEKPAGFSLSLFLCSAGSSSWCSLLANITSCCTPLGSAEFPKKENRKNGWMKRVPYLTYSINMCVLQRIQLLYSNKTLRHVSFAPQIPFSTEMTRGRKGSLTVSVRYKKWEA